MFTTEFKFRQSDSKERGIEGLFYTLITPLVYDLFEQNEYQ